MPIDDFFDSTEELRTIHQWARARFAAPWAVFGATLLRVAASTGPEVQLPGIIGGRASLNLLAAFVSASGGGKGISDKVSRLAWPAPIIERPIGSGEGIAALFAPPKKEGAERVTRAIINVTEIDTLAGIASRQGSILLAQLKAMAMGELLGQSNASEATSRVVQPHTYRCCLSVGAQPGHTSVIFGDTTGGTPQRFLWFPTVDPDMPDTAADDPEPLNTNLPAWTRAATDVVEIQYDPEEIASTVIQAHLARQRGEANTLDGHAVLTRLKVAATLAVMHHRSVVSDLDWQLSEEVMAVSDRTRDWIVTEAQQAARAKVRDRAIARAAGEEFYESSRLETVKRSIYRMLDRDGEQAGSDLRRRLGTREKRDLFDQAMSLLEHEGVVSSVPGQTKGVRYRLIGHGDQGGHPTNPQVSSGDQVGHGDHTDNVTDLDTRRWHDPRKSKPSAREWFEEHINQLRAEGQTTAKAFAVYEAGVAAGHSKSTLAQAASAHPEVTVIDRSAGTATWSIVPGEQKAYVPASAWVIKYLDGLPADATVVDQAHFRAAAIAAGYDPSTARTVLHKSDRIVSEPAVGNAVNNRIWRLTGQSEGEESA